jgi:type 2 lantibiotic biosynthesis protein LanM
MPMIRSVEATASEPAVDNLYGPSEVWRAMGVAERLALLRSAGGVGSVGSAIDGATYEATRHRLASWRAERTLDEQRALHDPRQIYGCTDDELQAILSAGPIQLHDTSALPSWARSLNEAWARGTASRAPPIVAEGSDPAFSFLPIVEPLVKDAVERVAAEAVHLAGAQDAPFSPSVAVRALQRTLVSRLAALIGRTGVLELHAARLRQELSGNTPAERFESFVEQLADPATGKAILQRSPVLGRLCFRVAENWTAGSRDFLVALTQDWPHLCREFGLSARDELIDVSPTGDLHRCGRSVLALRFSSGRKLVYKPRSLAIETEYQRLLGWLSGQPRVPALRQLTVVAAGDHGWVEYVEPAPCPGDEANALYRRYGVTLALLYVLAAGDCHFENVVAAGSHPVVLDLETLFHAFPASDVSRLGPAEQAVVDRTTGSVLGVGLLPTRRWSNALGRSVDVSGLGGRSHEWARAKRPRWEGEFTDAMREVLSEGSGETLADEGDDPREADALARHLDDVADGFATGYRALLARRDELLRPDGPLEPFREVETRSVLRPSGHYMFVLQSITHPSFVCDGVNLDRRLNRLLAAEDGRPPDSPITESERADMWQLDVPLFRTNPTSNDIVGSGGRCIPSVLAETGLERAGRRISTMSESDLELQLWLIRLSIGAWVLNRSKSNAYGDKAALPLQPNPAHDALDCAATLATRVGQLAISRGGEATWIGTRYWPGDETWAVDALGSSLFDGLSGIVLFLAYAGEVLRARPHVDLAREALCTLERQLDRVAVADAPHPFVGFSGVGGWIHALTHVGVLWNDDRLLARAVDLVSVLLRALDDAVTVDFIGGAAGAIRPLLNLYELTRSDEVLSAAVACGEHILARAEPQAAGVGWTSPAGPVPLTGFSHGAAGVTWALLKLYEAVHDRRYVDGAVAGRPYERSHFSTTEGNWRDLRSQDAAADLGSAPFLHFWCHGSVGIGMSRLDTFSSQRDDGVLVEIEAAVRATYERGFRSDHSLCHGYPSAAELMLLAERAGIATAQPPNASSWGEAMVNSIRQHGFVTGFPLGIETPGLMMGTAGIGYGLLRLTVPDRVPSVLLLEPPHDHSSA